MYSFFIVDNGSTVILLTFSFSHYIQNNSLIKSHNSQNKTCIDVKEKILYMGMMMTELNGVVISVVKVTFVQTCASIFDFQRDSKVGLAYLK